MAHDTTDRRTVRNRFGTRPLILETVALMTVAGVAWYYSYDFAGRDTLFRWGAEFWPRVVASLMAMLAVLQYWVRVHAPTVGPRIISEPPSEDHSGWTRVAIILVVPLIYAWFLPRMGFFALTPFFIFAMMFLFGTRRPLHLFGTSLLIFAIFVLVFMKLLNVPLPRGYWPAFYSFNTSFQSLIGL